MQIIDSRLTYQQILVVVNRLYLKHSKNHIDLKRKSKDKMKGVNDNARGLIEK